MNVLSLFDGISCGQQALKELGAPIENYYASEIDKHAIAITQHQHPNTIQLGDVTKWREWDIDWASIDLLQGGSPCQGFSFAGKQLNFEDPRSKLFFEYVDILNHIKKHNPNVRFLLENVRMKKEYQDVISEQLGVQPVTINSALVSAQNRVRLYWCNWKVEQPEDRGILLKDILEDAGEIHQRPRGKNKGGIHTEKSPTLTANKWEDNNKLCLGGVIRGRYTQTGKTKQRLEINGTEKANSLTTVQKDSLCVQVGTANIKGFDSIKRVYSPDGKSPTLTTMGGGHREPKVVVREKSKCVRSSGLGSYDRHEWDSVGNFTPTVLTTHTLRSILELYSLNAIQYEQQETYTNKILQTLWNFNDQKKMEEQIGDIISLYAESILQQDLYGTGNDRTRKQINKMVSIAQQSKKQKVKGGLRDLWKEQCEGCASQGWKLHKQSYKQFREDLQKLPQFGAQEKDIVQNMWSTEQGARVLREALSKVQEIWKSTYDRMGGTPLMWRKLSVTECERLQTLPDGFTAFGNYDGEVKEVANSNRYRALGNGWTVEVIKHIYRGIIT